MHIRPVPGEEDMLRLDKKPFLGYGFFQEKTIRALLPLRIFQSGLVTSLLNQVC